MSTPRPTQPALLLIGPTGSGKTPLGELIDRNGLWGRAWRHFDFGATMRSAVAAAERASAADRGNETAVPSLFTHLTVADIELMRDVLRRGVLLEDHQFSMARRLLDWFLDRPANGKPSPPEVPTDRRKTWLVLNGLPRHVGQAEAMREWVDVRGVVELACDAEMVRRRIARNTGGDRGERTDDSAAEIARKLDTYQRRTAPLLEFYGRAGATRLRIDVSAEMGPQAMWAELQQANAAGMAG